MIFTSYIRYSNLLVPCTSGLLHSEITGSKLARQLPGAYRSPLRPSSVCYTKASIKRINYLHPILAHCTSMGFFTPIKSGLLTSCILLLRCKTIFLKLQKRQTFLLYKFQYKFSAKSYLATFVILGGAEFDSVDRRGFEPLTSPVQVGCSTN